MPYAQQGQFVKGPDGKVYTVAGVGDDGKAILEPARMDLPRFEARQAPALKQAEIAAKLLLTADPNAQADIIQSALPDANILRRPDGLIEIEYNGERGFLNKPGLSRADFIDFTAGILKFIPAAKLAALGKTLLTRAGIGAVASGATSVGEDMAAGVAGSGQGIDPARAGFAAAGGAAGELLAPAARAVGNRLRGADPSAVADDVSSQVRRQQEIAARQAVTPEAAEGVATGRSFGIDSMTRGQVTQSKPALDREWILANNGGPAQDIMERQANRLREQVMGVGEQPTGLTQLQRELGGTGRTLPQAADEVVGGIRSSAGQLGRAVDDAYDAARSAYAALEPEAAVDAFRSLRRGVAKSGVAITDDMPTLKAILGRANRNRLQLVSRIKQGKPTRLRTLQIMENFRREISTNLAGLPPGSERRAMTAALREWDSWMDDAFANDLIKGEKEALDAWKNARGLRSRFSRLFEKDRRPGAMDDAGPIMQRIINSDVTPEEAANLIFGASDLGGKNASYRIVKRLKDAWANDPEKMNALRELAFNKIVSRATNRAGTISYANLRNALNEGVRGRGRPLAQQLWTPEQLQRVDEFVRILNAIAPRPDVGNPSRTSVVGAQLLRDWLGPFGAVLSAFKVVFPTSALKGLEAAAATRPPVQQIPAAVRATAPAAASNFERDR